MMVRFAMLGASIALVATATIAACAGDKGEQRGNAPDATPTPDAPLGGTPIGGCSGDNLVACEYPSRSLTYAKRDGIATAETKTGRTLPLYVRIPALPGPLPVVVWSHGGGFFADGELESTQWGVLLAKHGYVVVHVGHSPLLADSAKKYCELASVPKEECVPSADEDANGVGAIGRSYDLAAVLDDLPRLSEVSTKNGGPALDLARVALAGWSGGSRGPNVLMGAKIKPTANAPIFTNPHARPAAAIFMSPSGPTFGGFYETASDNSWNNLRGPTFSATGTNDQKPEKPELTGAVRRMSFPLQPADGKRFMLFSNLAVGVGEHGTYNLGDTGSSDPRLDRVTRAIGSIARAFLDANLDANAEGKAWMASSNAGVLAGEAEWLNR